MDLVLIRSAGAFTGEGLSVSPDGRHVAFELHQADVEANTYRVGWFVAPTVANARAWSVGDGGDPLLFRRVDDSGYTNGAWIPEDAKWSFDSNWIFYRRRVDDETQIWRSSRSGDTQEQVTHSAADVQRFEWSADRSKLYFAVDAPRALRQEVEDEDQESGQGYVFDPALPWSVQHGKPRESRYSLIGGKPSIWVYDFASGAERQAAAGETEAYERVVNAASSRVKQFGRNARVVAPSKDGRLVAWLAPAFPEKQGMQPPLTLYASRFPNGRNAVRCRASECTGILAYAVVRDLWWSDDGRQIYFVRQDGPNYGRKTLYSWSVARNQVRKVLEIEDWISSCSQAGQRAICFRETPTHPRTVIAINLQTGAVETLVDPNPEFRNLQLGEVTRIEWSDAEDRSTFGYLVKPLGYEQGKRYPLIIVGYRARNVVHGGTGHEYPVHVFAANGLVVLTYEMPEAWDLKATAKDAAELLARSWGEDLFELSAPLSSLEAAIDLLDAQGLVDPTRVGITGFSTGAHQVSYALVNSSRFAAASMSQPTWSPVAYYLTGGGSFLRELSRKIGLGPLGRADDRSWKPFSLTLNVDEARTPLLINASDEEYLPAMETIVSLSEQGKPLIEMYVYPEEHHVKWFPKHRYSIYQRNLDWFNFWLRGVEDPVPRKVAQYQRWRGVRSVFQVAASGRADGDSR